MKETKIRINSFQEIPGHFTGIAEYANGTKIWYKDGLRHRENGPAVECADGRKYWYLKDERYSQIALKDQIILDEYEGKYNLMWYKLLDKDKIIEYPDIPGLITK
jgi:aminopeptidase N